MDLKNWSSKWRISKWTPNSPLPTWGSFCFVFFGGGKRVNCLVVFSTHFNPNNSLLILLQISVLFMCTPPLIGLSQSALNSICVDYRCPVTNLNLYWGERWGIGCATIVALGEKPYTNNNLQLAFRSSVYRPDYLDVKSVTWYRQGFGRIGVNGYFGSTQATKLVSLTCSHATPP